MARPRRSTRDEWIDTFADWDADSQEAALDLATCVHRQTRRTKPRKDEEAVEQRADAAKPQPAAHTAAAEQPSLTGLPDENEVGSEQLIQIGIGDRRASGDPAGAAARHDGGQRR